MSFEAPLLLRNKMLCSPFLCFAKFLTKNGTDAAPVAPPQLRFSCPRSPPGKSLLIVAARQVKKL
jgi:hypothetical protein